MSLPLPNGSNELPSKFGGVSALEYICKSRTLVSLRFSIPSASHTHLAFRASRYSPKAYGKSLIATLIQQRGYFFYHVDTTKTGMLAAFKGAVNPATTPITPGDMYLSSTTYALCYTQ